MEQVDAGGQRRGVGIAVAAGDEKRMELGKQQRNGEMFVRMFSRRVAKELGGGGGWAKSWKTKSGLFVQFYANFDSEYLNDLSIC
jgi:hypothetical protein